MKLINNRFRITGVINQGQDKETYIIKDLHKNENKKFLTVYNYERAQEAIEYFTEEFKSLVNIKHKNLMMLEEFDIIESINLKKTNQSMYYTLNEYKDSTMLIDVKDNISLENCLLIILELMSVIDYLHFRGQVYKHLSPTNIFVAKDYSIKIMDLASIFRDFKYSLHDYLTELFIAPEIFSNNGEVNKYADYYSIGMIMIYLLFENLHIDEDINKNYFKDEFNLSENQKIFLRNTIKNLTHKDPALRKIPLQNHIKNIITAFNIDFEYDLVKERDYLILDINVVGRDNEINTLLEIDNNLSKGIKKFSGAIISGGQGSGKTKLLNEIAFRYSILNRTVFYINGRNDISSGSLNIVNLLKVSLKNTPNEIKNKYSDDFNKLLNYNAEGNFIYDALKDKTIQEKYSIYNRLNNYFADLTKNKPAYILIDDLYAANDDFISFLSYMMFKLENNKIFVIATTLNSELVQNKNMARNIKAMINQGSILHLELGNFSEADTGRFVKSILGINYVPNKFTSFIYKVSLGNPNYIYYIIKDLYNRKELYMSEKGIWKTKEKDYNRIIITIDENHVINCQLKDIEGDCYKVLELISLSKDIITKETLMKMLEVEEKKLDSIIKSLVETKIIDIKIYRNIEILRINNKELKRIVYSRIDYNRKVKLHKEAVSTITKLYEDDYQFMMEELLHHLRYSDQSDYALEIVLTEAKKQVNRFSSYSISLWEHAYNLVKNTDNDEILNILDSLITIYDIKGYVELKAEFIAKMHKISLEKNNLKYLIKAKYHQIEIYISSNQLDEAIDLISEIEEIVNDNEDLYEGRILFLISKSKLNLSTSKFIGMVDYLKEAISISRENNVLKYLGTIYNLYGSYNYLNGIAEEAIKFFNKSIEAYDLDMNKIEGIKPINNIGNIYANVYGDDKRALEYYQKGYKIASKYEFAKASAVFTSNIGDTYFRNLHLKEATQYYEVSRNISNEIGDYKGIILSNLNLGMIYLKVDKCDKAIEIYNFIEDINKEDLIKDIEVLRDYYTFMGEYNHHFGRIEESLKYYQLLSEITKDFNSREHLLAESNILAIRTMYHTDYNKEKLEDIINKYDSNNLNNRELELILTFALIAINKGDKYFAKRILYKYPENNQRENDSLRALRDIINVMLNPNRDGLSSLRKYENKEIYMDYKFLIHTILAYEWAKIKNYIKAINHSFKALNNLIKRTELIRDKSIKYFFILRRNGDKIKSDLCKLIELEFNIKIDYISLNEAYTQDLRYNDLVNILDQLSLSDYRQIKNIDNKYEEIDSIETLLYEFTYDNQRNLDLILNYLGYETLANRGFILRYNEEDKSYSVISTLVEGDKSIPRENLLIQSNRSSVGILINKNFKNMEDSKYIELLPEDAVSIICVPIIKNEKVKYKFDRRKKNSIRFLTPLEDNIKIYVYLETDSYLNKFEYDKLILIKHIASLIQLNIENKNLKDITVIDKLTGVLTRKYFEQQIEYVIEEYNKYQGTFSLLMIDIDNFKGLNDNYGHLVGDDVLSIIGATIKESVRSSDLVARFGGEEFIVLLFDTSIEEGLIIADKIRANILNIRIFDVERELSASIGLAQYPDHGQTKNELIGKADQALYIAKEKQGKNCSVVWDIYLGEGINTLNSLAGILTGNINRDNFNISTVINTASLIGSEISEYEKIAEFTNSMLEVLEARYATFIKCENNNIENTFIYKTEIKSSIEWMKAPKLNMKILKRVIKNKRGEFLVDWDNSETVDPITEEQMWQSILVLPLIRSGIVLGIIYISVPLKEKEFTFEDLNFGNLLSNIFAAVLNT